MANKKEEFRVTDRRLFTPEGEVRPDVAEEESRAQTTQAEQTSSGAHAATQGVPPPPVSPESPEPQPAPPSAEEQKTQSDAYHQSTRDLDDRLRQQLGEQKSQNLEMTFERFLASLYMTALLQLGLVHEQGAQPQIDLMGARQTIDTIGLLKDKTKGNLTAAEEAFIQNVLYELRMAYIEVTNALARGPRPQDVSDPVPPTKMR